MQALADLPGRVTRVLVAVAPGHEHQVRVALKQLVNGRPSVERSDVEIAYVNQAATPNNESSGLFAGICAIVGSLFTLGAMLLTVPERRRLVAELRIQGAKRYQVAAQSVGYLREAFPRGHVDLGTAKVGVDLGSLTRDPDDEHVCALALSGSAELLLTFDRGYRRAELQALGVTVLDPDGYLVGLLGEEPDAVLASVWSTARAWGGGRPVGELIDAFERAGAERFAEQLRAAGL